MIHSDLRYSIYIIISILIAFSVSIANKKTIMAQEKVSSAHICIKNADNTYLSFKHIPKLNFECIKSNCKCLNQFDIQNINKKDFKNDISISDNRTEPEKKGYNLSVAMENFICLDNRGKVKDIIKDANSITLKLGNHIIKSNIRRNIESQNDDQNKATLSTVGSMPSGNYVGFINWTLSPAFNNVNEI